MVIFIWFSLTDSDICANSAIQLVSAIMLHEDVAFKTISDRYTNSRIVPFLTHIDEFRANLFSRNPRQKMTSTMVNQQLFFFFFFFFTVKLDATNSFLLIWQRYDLSIWKWVTSLETLFCHMWTTKAQISLPVHATPILFPGVDFCDKSFW